VVKITQVRKKTMSVLAHTPDFALRRALRASRPGLLRRLLTRFVQWRQRRAEQEIAIRLGLTSGRLTDEIERQISERLLNGGGFRS
jgi:hypothetical protein